MRLLVVEDEVTLNNTIVEKCQQAGFACDSATDGREGLFLASENPYDLAIIDLGLPEIDGISLIRRLREQNILYPVFILTARDAWQDKVEGLEAGADDYLTKPFHPEELMARVQALLRRAHGLAKNVAHFGPLALDTQAKTVRLDGNIIELTSYEYNTLAYLALNTGKAISKTELTEHLYDQDFDRDSNVIEVFIGRLRKKLDPDGSLNMISTQRGLGYRFNLEQNG
ncbi:response regulator transcription factor [Gilvimarinus agarilyticus]|uniref:response regulator transcription factor n=1 Tax=unclassified Gilvimarinus TaxID=2642066 RepID=UPI001C0845F8|nr:MULTISPECIES: response regulator transcription factor [unclassified Gilvimarinus]MBU2887623.1 response regulator transcription factor [Gilvimarinus agarilyticus]MDO6572274.1 response regulator transcription factor [Gilvimarinus sp. 2_MG-2023]MDO6746841.1 response regulator transcription factor [Gilvimarinus sp. 1_MG-2023]